MIRTIYGRSLKVLAKKPFHFFGISILADFFVVLAGVLFGIVPGIYLGIAMLLETGAVMVYLHGYKGDELHVEQVFEGFKDGATAKRVLGGMAWMYLWIFLWSLIPIVGFVFAIIKYYQYRLTPYILMQEPDVKPTQAIKVSMERTNGYCGKMFLADILPGLAVFVLNIALGLLSFIPVIGVVFAIVLVVLDIVAIFFVGFFQKIVQAAFYEEIQTPTLALGGERLTSCPNCGAHIPSDAIFCTKCGSRVQPQEEKKEEAKVEPEVKEESENKEEN